MYIQGSPRIEVDGQLIHLDRQKSVALLAYLVVTQRPHSREWLATLLWPDIGTSRTQLRNALAVIRHQLGSSVLRTTWDEVGIAEGALSSDVEDLLRVSTGFAQGHVEPALNVPSLLALYPDHLLSGFTLRDAPDFDSWQRVEEQRLRTLYERMVDFAVTRFIQQQHYPSALTLAHHWVTINPFNEHARRQLIRLYAWTNQRARAVHEYQRLRADVWENHRAEPEPETNALYEQLQSGASIHEVRPRISQLPPIAPLIGRQNELAVLVRLMREKGRLISITGPGGIGKTHLALAIAHELEQEFADGCCFITLEDGAGAESLIVTLLHALAVPRTMESSPADALFEAIRSKRLLIVLDSVHHVTDAPSVIRALLQNTLRTVLLVTSYHPLDMSSEYCFALEGLAVGSGTEQTPANESAIELFAHGAKRVQPNFERTPAIDESIIQICQLVSGIPLGILLASSWCAVLTPKDIAEEIRQNYDFLHVNHQDVPERHQSLRAVFEAAWLWLTPAEQRALMNLALFPDSFTRRAAEQVSNVHIGVLKSLTTKALISFSPARQRYLLHDVSRRYAREKLAADGSEADIRVRYQVFYAAFLTDRVTSLKGHLKEVAWQEIELELGHIRTVWRSALAELNIDLILQMMEPLQLFFQSRGWEEGVLLFDEARQAVARMTAADSVYLKLLMRFYPADRGAERWLRDLYMALDMAVHQQDVREIAYLHREFGWYWLNLEQYQTAHDYFAQAESHYRAEAEHFFAAVTLRGMAYAAVGNGDHQLAQRYARNCLRLRRAIGDHEGEHEARVLLAELALMSGDMTAAGRDFEEAFSYFHSRYSNALTRVRTHSIGWWYVFGGQYSEADRFAEGLLANVSSSDISACIAHAVKVAAFAITGQLDAMTTELELVEESLTTLTIWPSFSNLDNRFWVNYSRLLAVVLLDDSQQTLDLLNTLAEQRYFERAIYRVWLTPLLIVAACHAGAERATVDALIAYCEGSFLSRLPWLAGWRHFQRCIADPHAQQRAAHPALSALLQRLWAMYWAEDLRWEDSSRAVN